MERWKKGFAKHQPNIRIDFQQDTSDAGFPALYTGKVDLLLTSRVKFFSLLGFEIVYEYDPVEIRALRPGVQAATQIFVNKANPLQKVTFDQLDGIFGAQRTGGFQGTVWQASAARSADKNIRTWGQLGLSGEWKDKPIHVYGSTIKPRVDNGMETLVFHGGDKWNEALREYADKTLPDGTIETAGRQIVQALQHDKYGIAFATVPAGQAAAKALPISASAAGPFLHATAATVQARRYPLAGDRFWYTNLTPGKALDPPLREFLRYTLSPEGQAAAVATGKYLPIPPHELAESARGLDDIHVNKLEPRTNNLPKQRATVPAFDVSNLPLYAPQHHVSGTLRIWGSSFIKGELAKAWEDGFHKFQPGVKIEYNLRTAANGVPGLYAGVADIAADRPIMFDELLTYQRVLHRSPIEIPMVTGTFDEPGASNPQAIFVNTKNPISKISLQQLEGVFGAQRTGAYIGTQWRPELSRGPEGNIRTWGQLGLTGDWANKPIHTYGVNLQVNPRLLLEERVFNGGDKWNEDLREYANFYDPNGVYVLAPQTMMKDLSGDPYGITYTGMEYKTPQTKPLALAQTNAGPFFDLTIENVQKRSYPLYMEEVWYIDRVPGEPLDPRVQEYMRYVLSRQGQQDVVNGRHFIPLTREVVEEQLKKLQ
jgi:ABC-type phosphate transport system substrate-binding protein